MRAFSSGSEAHDADSAPDFRLFAGSRALARRVRIAAGGCPGDMRRANSEPDISER
jgi:hypothetical protein